MEKSALQTWVVLTAGFVLLSGCDPQGGATGDSLKNTDFGKDSFVVTAERYLSEASASSSLSYDVTNHLVYEAKMAVDENWGTAWCSMESNPTWTLSFDQSTDLGNLGIVPGYAATEDLFFKNPRVKSLELFYDGKSAGGFSLEDRYGMQFFTLNLHDIEVLELKILETYPGSKYTDTCLAEVDAWGDFVATKDDEAALANHEKTYYGNQICEDGHDFPDVSTAAELRQAVVVEPTETTQDGRHYWIEDWALGFWVPLEYGNYHVFRGAFGSDALSFGATTDAACLAYGDMMGIYLKPSDYEANVAAFDPSFMTQGAFSYGPVHGYIYREDWFGGDILSYLFLFKEQGYLAATLACPLGESDCSIRDEAFLKGLLGTLE